MEKRISSNLIKLICLILICFCTKSILAQTSWQNQKKYWFYKVRLNNDFVKVGLNAGESFVVGQRAHNTTNFLDVTNDKMNWGDATATLGHYLAYM